VARFRPRDSGTGKRELIAALRSLMLTPETFGALLDMFRDHVFDWTSTSVMVDHDNRIRARGMENLRDRQFELLQRQHCYIKPSHM
jgi:hypothetical protein